MTPKTYGYIRVSTREQNEGQNALVFSDGFLYRSSNVSSL